MKITKILIVVMISVSMIFSSCAQTAVSNSPENSSSQQQPTSEKISVVVTTFPIYDWMTEIIKNSSENIELSLLIDNGVDLHSYQPTTEDIADISTADLFIYNGGDSDEWVKEVVSQAMNADIVSVSLMDTLSEIVVAEETKEGMQSTGGHDHGTEDEHVHEEDEHVHEEDEHVHEEDEHAHDHVETGHSDEHIWLSLNNAVEICELLAETLSNIDPDNREAFEASVDNYIAELIALDDEYEEALGSMTRDTLLFADRFPFRYLVDDYDISYYAAFPGCSAETEASFETITFLSQKVDELSLSNVLIIDAANDSIAKTVISSSENNSAEILVLNSMQSVTADDIEAGVTYLSVMGDNLEVLKKALS